MMNYSLRSLLVLMTLVGIASGAMLKPATYWAPLLTNVSVALQLAAIVTCCYGVGSVRAQAAGFAIGNGFFLIAEFIPAIGKPLVQRMLPWALWSSDSSLLIGQYASNRAYLGSLLSGLIYGYGCALLARRLYQKHAT